MKERYVRRHKESVKILSMRICEDFVSVSFEVCGSQGITKRCPLFFVSL
jgi:hypothetical protein